MSMRAIVKSVLSADTLVLRNRPVGGHPPKERTLHLAGLDAPRTGTRDRPDEPWAFESREFTRVMLVGKEVAFSITYTVPTGGEFGLVHLIPPAGGGPPTDVALEVVRSGWSKLRDASANARDGEDDTQAERRRELKEAEDEAKREQNGMWGTKHEHPQTDYSMPADPAAFLAKYKGIPIAAIVESVSNGTTLRARLMLTDTQHQFVTLTMAGVRAPRARAYATHNPLEGSAAEGEPFGDEARFFSESRLLQRNVTVRLLGLPTPQSSAGANGGAVPQASVVGSFVGLTQHPAGSIMDLLLANGLARIVDWHAGFLSSVPPEDGGGMERLRIAEKAGKANRRGIWKDAPVTAPSNPAAAAAQAAGGKKWEGVVTRVWAGDALSVRRVGDKEEEKRLQVSSIRIPRAAEVKLAGIGAEARELLRKRLIGKTVSVSVDYTRPPEGNYEERECATVRLPNGINIAHLLVERGLAGVLRHRQGDGRASDYDELMAAETKAQGEGKGIHSGKDFPVPKITEVSETAARASSFLAQFKRQGRIPVVVDFVASGSRFKIYVPKQELKLTLVLSGIRCPRTARNAGEKAEPFGQEAYDFVNRIAMQRDAEIEVEATDKSGGFIGALYLNKTNNVAVSLVKEGLASFSEYSAERLSFSKALSDAEAEAKKAKKNIWRDYDGEAEAEIAIAAISTPAAKTDYKDIIVSDVRTDPSFSFSVQILQEGGIPELIKLMEDFAAFHLSASSVAPPAYRNGDLVSARFTADDAWYRAKIRRSNPAKKEAEVIFIDYGNSEVLPYSRLRPLDPRFKSLPPQAKDAILSFVKLPGNDTEYGAEAVERFRALAEGRQLVANLDYKEPGAAGLLHMSLYDPSMSPDVTSSINTQLVREGLARIDNKAKYVAAYPAQLKAMEAARAEAKRERAGAYEFGDILDDE